MVAPAVAAAGIGALGSIAGGILGGNANAKAIKKATKAQERASRLDYNLGLQSLGLQRDVYDENKGMMSPFIGRGNVAGDAINALLGLPTGQAAINATPGLAPAGAMSEDEWAQQALDALAGEVAPKKWATVNSITDPSDKLNALIPNLAKIDRQVYQGFLAMNPRPPAGSTGSQGVPTPVGAPVPANDGGTTFNPAQTQEDAFRRFADSAGMRFQQDEALRALEHYNGGRGTLDSGAAYKSATDRAQQIALQNYFMPYMGLLGGQQATGAQSGAAVAGVGSNFANAASGIYGNMGQGAVNQGANAANAFLAQGANKANMWNGIGSALGTFASSFGK